MRHDLVSPQGYARLDAEYVMCGDLSRLTPGESYTNEELNALSSGFWTCDEHPDSEFTYVKVACLAKRDFYGMENNIKRWRYERVE